jgi:hypothetical protein
LSNKRRGRKRRRGVGGGVGTHLLFVSTFHQTVELKSFFLLYTYFLFFIQCISISLLQVSTVLVLRLSPARGV